MKRTAIAFEIALTYKFMHDAGVVHRDVKSYNVLLDNQLHVKICDFGLARFKVRGRVMRVEGAKSRHTAVLRDTCLHVALNVPAEEL